MIQDAATASSSIIDETMAMLNEQDTLDNVKAKLKNHLLTYNDDETRKTTRFAKVVLNFAKYADGKHIDSEV